MQDYDIDLDTSEHVDLPLLREGDQYLIEWFISLGFQGETLAQLNRCRLFHHALTRADVITGDGRRLRPSVLETVSPPPASTYQWPTEKPGLLDHAM